MAAGAASVGSLNKANAATRGKSRTMLVSRPSMRRESRDWQQATEMTTARAQRPRTSAMTSSIESRCARSYAPIPTASTRCRSRAVNIVETSMRGRMASTMRGESQKGVSEGLDV
jgi:hypothetical protein